MAKYLACWDSKYYDVDKKSSTQTHTLTWFNEKRGYTKTSISKIKKLRVGQSIEIEKGHTIVRLS